MPKKQRRKYYAYLLRLWQERETAPWRATLESPHTGERHGFADLRQFISFLEAQTGESLTSEEEDKE
jgi:hypothetical protein